MDSLGLVSFQKEDNFPLKKLDFKGIKLIKCIIISLILLFILNSICPMLFIYTAYLIFNLNIKKFEIDNKSNVNKSYKSFNINNNNLIIEEYIKRQKNFCNFSHKFYNKKFEKLIKLANFSFRNISFQMYTYKESMDWMSRMIIKTAKYEPKHMSNFLDALKYYGGKNNIKKNEDIFMLDIGGNMGVYPSFLGKFGYSILTFEASPRNSYIIYKNYCSINKNSNIIIVNKGLSNEEKTCYYYSQIKRIGNGLVLCNINEERTRAGNLNFKKMFEVKLIKLSNLLPYLSNKNIALIYCN